MYYKQIIEPHDAILLKGGDNEELLRSLKTLISSNNGINFSYNILIEGCDITPIIITGRDEEQEVPVFKYPTFFELNGVNYCATDLRQLVKFKEFETDITKMGSNGAGIESELTRLILSIKYKQNPASLANLATVTAKAMSIWISKTMTQAMGLSVHEAVTVDILISQYFNFVTVQQSGSFDDDYSAAMFRTGKGLGNSGLNTAREVLSKFEPVINIEVLVEEIAKSTPKLKRFNMEALKSIIANGVYIPNAFFVLVNGLEHFPTMVTLIHTATTQRLNNRSKLNTAIKGVNDLSLIIHYHNKYVASAII